MAHKSNPRLHKAMTRRKHALLRSAVHANGAASRRGMLERLFTLAFKGFVYPQIWEDPAVDLAALEIGPDSRIVTIASGGCNVMSYLTAEPERITALDLNPAHVALTRLKLAGIKSLPGYEAFFRFFGFADERANLAAYDRHIKPGLDPESRAYWDRRRLTGGRQITLFTRNLYRFGLLGRTIGLVHLIARLHGRNPRRMLDARTLEEQRWLYESLLAPMFDKRLVRAVCRMPVSLYGLGIPPAQYQALAGEGADVADVLRLRLERLACDFPMQDNYFAWQAFGRRYDRQDRRAVPPYLKREHYDTVRAGADRVTVEHAAMTEWLAGQEDDSLDRYVLLDAQDWMTPEQLTDLWRQITRTARPGARVIFRTAGTESLLPGRVPDGILGLWTYDPDRCRALGATDRSSIYGGFHLYTLKPAA